MKSKSIEDIINKLYFLNYDIQLIVDQLTELKAQRTEKKTKNKKKKKKRGKL